jgi:hypothetical protein
VKRPIAAELKIAAAVYERRDTRLVKEVIPSP